MRGIRRIFHLPRSKRDRLESEVDDEIAFHLEMRARSLLARGFPSSQADAEAERRFGDLKTVRDDCIHEGRREMRKDRILNLLDQTAGDLRFAIRSLARAPVFATVAIATLVIGIASVTTVVSFVNAVFFRPLPYNNVNRLVGIVEQRRGSYTATIDNGVSLGVLRQLRQQGRSFERVGAYSRRSDNVIIGDQPVVALSLEIDSSFAELFALRAQVGRLLVAEDFQTRAPVGVISDLLWRTRFGARSDVVGQTMRVDGRLVTIVGVMAGDFRFPHQTDLWRPMVDRTGPDADDSRFGVIGMLRDGVSAASARVEMQQIAQRIAQADPRRYDDMSLQVSRDIVDRGKRLLAIPILFLGAAIFVLLVACTNVANLLMVRAAERRGEMAIRAAIGGSRSRLMRQTLTESLILGLTAAAIGTLLSTWAVKIVLGTIPTVGFPSWLRFDLDLDVLAFTVILSMVVTIAVGLAPALRGTRFDIVRSLKAGGDGGAARRGTGKAARRGVVLQLTLGVALFIGAALLARSYYQFSRLDVGYPAAQIAVVEPLFDRSRYPDEAAEMRILRDAAAQLLGRPDIASISLRGSFWGTRVPEKQTGPYDSRLFVDNVHSRSFAGRGASPRWFVVSDSYFGLLSLPIVQGRAFGAGDDAGAPLVGVVSREFARMAVPDENPIGHIIRIGEKGDPVVIVGVTENVRDLRSGSAGIHADPRPDVYLSERQVIAESPALLLRARGDAAAVHATAVKTVRELDPQLRIGSETTLASDNEPTRLVISLGGKFIGALALSAMVLAVIGIYGVVAYGVQQRRREIGIRLALGGTAAGIQRMFMRDSMRFVSSGICLGLMLTLAAGRLLVVFLFGVSPFDPSTYLAVALFFAAIALLACYIPARRVSRVEPVTALRSE